MRRDRIHQLLRCAVREKFWKLEHHTKTRFFKRQSRSADHPPCSVPGSVPLAERLTIPIIWKYGVHRWELLVSADRAALTAEFIGKLLHNECSRLLQRHFAILDQPSRSF